MGVAELEIQMDDLGSQIADVHYVANGDLVVITRVYVYFDGHRVNVVNSLADHARQDLIEEINKEREELANSRQAVSGDRDFS